MKIKQSLTLLSSAILFAFQPVSYAKSQESSAKVSDEDIEVITVKGRASQFYFVSESAMATKTPTDFMDIPQAVQVLSQELISDQAARQTTDLYRSISGMTQFSYSGITARGFRQDQVRYDGVQGDPYGGFSIPQLFNVERVEVLKGPSGMLYGGGQPGGLINYVTKKPKFNASHEIALFTGTDDLQGAFIDSTDALNSDASLAYRVGGFYQRKKPFRNNTDEKNTLISTGLTWIVNDSTSLSLQYDFIDQDLAGHRLRGVPVDDEGNFLTDISYSPNEKTDFQRVKGDVIQLIAEAELTNNLSNTTVIRYLDNERSQNYHENRGLKEDGRSMVREFRDQLRFNEEVSITTDFVYQNDLANMKHTILVGGDYFDLSNRSKYSIGRGSVSNIADIDIINPQYGSNPANYLLAQRPESKNTVQRAGVYIQDQIEVNSYWQAILGGRYDYFKDTNKVDNTSFSDNDFSPRAGIVYQPNDTLSTYLTVSYGFQPQSAFTLSDGLEDPDNTTDISPENSKQWELGIKKRWFNDRIMSTVSFYNISKTNVVVSNPEDTGIADGKPSILQIGEVTSKGVEVDIVGDITDVWTATLNYAYNNAEITGGIPDDISNSVGKEFANAPDHTLGLWTRYDFTAINSAFAIGLDHVSDRVSLSNQKVKAYTVWDASWRTQYQGFDIQLNIKNIFDKTYATSGFNKRNGHFPGEPRTVLLQVSRQF